ncbi:MAG TPA: M20/M25/M40 family metallo-hydrolase [Blastocatellia bacterium]|nr:M20/M25/M40 family metallo-hydrolase [Blastocatellia bacterium]HMX26835.1 M20/M25/M40 family metallo-hydrolase [Blastocatellia bacterium]HMZ18983.1 M20/M25/M40 family metallo-hydrolase [Blastocatellia bacterium]HNG32462.1 M20/M25/M40 family metallo-hydrolase [Blastocatellia bacterium]
MPASILSFADRFRSPSIAELLREERVLKAFEFVDSSASRFTAEHIRICEIPAPPFKEQERGRYLAARFNELGLADVHTDSEGNVIGFYRGHNEQPLLVLSAHLDTVFPEGTDVVVRRVGSRLCAPGIADNCAGLAALIGLIQAMNAGHIKPRGSVAFVATVGEEGEGDLRGVRHLFAEGKLAGRVSAFVSFDGPGVDFITHQALGSRRYRITLEGPGGHSWGDFGVVNPVHALGRAVARMADYHAPAEPRTTYNIGRIEGGESVNVIPQTAAMDVDLRSSAEVELSRMEEYLLAAIHRAVVDENVQRAASGRKLKAEVRLIGNRPSGETPRDALLVRTAVEASRHLSITPILNRASTDSNIPISLKVPAVTIGVGGQSGDSHRLSEWYDPAGREQGYKRALLLALSMTGLA